MKFNKGDLNSLTMKVTGEGNAGVPYGMSEAREWWISSVFDAENDFKWIVGKPFENAASEIEDVRVIEYAAVEEANKEIERLKEAVEFQARYAEGWIEKYRHIEIANAEMSRNDHVNFGKLMAERDKLTQERDELKRQNELQQGAVWKTAISDADPLLKTQILVLEDINARLEQERDQLKAELYRTEAQNQRLKKKSFLTERNRYREMAMTLAEALEFCFESMCKHSGELRPGINRNWCHDCSSWVYESDTIGIREATKALDEYHAMEKPGGGDNDET